MSAFRLDGVEACSLIVVRECVNAAVDACDKNDRFMTTFSYEAKRKIQSECCQVAAGMILLKLAGTLLIYSRGH